MKTCAASGQCGPESVSDTRSGLCRKVSARGVRVAGCRAALTFALIVASPLVRAGDALSSLPIDLADGSLNLDLRVRYEHVKIDGPLVAPMAENSADALTARTRLSYTSGEWNKIDGQLEFEALSIIGNDDYNSFGNGHGQYPAIADAKTEELNQAWLRWSGLPETQFKYGRQRILLDNQRFVGNVGWRQTEMTYDAARLTITLIPKTTFNYAYLSNINSFRFFDADPSAALVPSDEIGIKGHLINTSVAALDQKLLLTVYGYLLDFGQIPPGSAFARLFSDTQTLGLRAGGVVPMETFALTYALEYAEQQDYADSMSAVEARYILVEAGIAKGKLKGTLGWEMLEGDGNQSFQTPLASAHAFQGWADQFLITPVKGLERLYACASTNVGRLSMTAVYHLFKANEGGVDYGSEADLLLSYAVIKPLVLNLKHARYSAGERGASALTFDTAKTWVYAEFRF